MPDKKEHYSIEVTKTAWDMLISHARFVANVSIPAAQRLIDAFSVTTENSAEMPERNPWLEHESIPYRKYRKQLFSKHYMALYEIQEKIIYVTAVVDCRQDYVWLL